MAHLVQESGEEKGKRFPLGKITVLGRLKSCDIPVKDHKASRTNTKIQLKGGAFVVEDLGSSNGTFLNDEKIRKVNLAHGDRVKIGKTVFRFENPPAAPRRAPPPKPAPAPPPRPKPPAPPPSPAIQAMADMETPPAGTPPPDVAPLEKAEEEVEEIDLGGGDLGDGEDTYPAPRPAPAAPTPKPKPAYIARVPLAVPKTGGRKPRTLLLEDISQRSGSFRAMIYIGVIALMGFLAYLAFHFASSAF